MYQFFFEGPSKKVKSKTLTAKYGPKIFEGPSKREIQKLNCQLWTKKKIEAQVKEKFENLNANCGPKKIEGPSQREIRKFNCQLWTNIF